MIGPGYSDQRAELPTVNRCAGAILACLASALVLSTLIACPGHAGYEHIKLRRQFNIIKLHLQP